MFKNLRKRINTVLPDIENIYLGGLSNSSPHTSPSRDFNSLASSSWTRSAPVNLEAGCLLLEQNEKSWEKLHAANEANASKAEICDRIIAKLTENAKQKAIDLADMNLSLEAIPQLNQTIENCAKIVMEINVKCSEVERQLFELEDLNETLHLQENKLNSKFELAIFKEQKLANLEKVRQNLSTKHAQTVQNHERIMRNVQLERQAVFEDAFQNDINYFKQSGRIPKIENRKPENSLNLEEIELENDGDKDELNKFLEDI